MKTIYKYQLKMEPRQVIKLPMGAVILTVQAQRDLPCLWAEINKDTQAIWDHTICIFGTGHTLPPTAINTYNYIGTFQILNGDFVGHVYEEVLNLAQA